MVGRFANFCEWASSSNRRRIRKTFPETECPLPAGSGKSLAALPKIFKKKNPLVKVLPIGKQVRIHQSALSPRPTNRARLDLSQDVRLRQGQQEAGGEREAADATRANARSQGRRRLALSAQAATTIDAITVGRATRFATKVAFVVVVRYADFARRATPAR